MAENNLKISYRQKDKTVCPVCGCEFNREDMLTGGGRLISGNITDELRRTFEKNNKYGVIYPLAYLVNVCPRCLYAAYPKDFGVLNGEELENIKKSTTNRLNSVKKYFGDINFNQDRNLELGAASYFLAVDCYNYRNKNVAPTFKKSVSSIRAAWLFSDMAAIYPDKPYAKISDFFYNKAYLFYMSCMDLVQSGGEPIEAAGNIGPDYDKNWGYEGIMYLCAVLTVKIGIKEPDINKRMENFEKTKRFLSRLFGSGKSSRATPGPLIDMTRDLYDKINKMLEEWNSEKQTPSAE